MQTEIEADAEVVWRGLAGGLDEELFFKRVDVSEIQNIRIIHLGNALKGPDDFITTWEVHYQQPCCPQEFPKYDKSYFIKNWIVCFEVPEYTEIVKTKCINL